MRARFRQIQKENSIRLTVILVWYAEITSIGSPGSIFVARNVSASFLKRKERGNRESLNDCRRVSLRTTSIEDLCWSSNPLPVQFAPKEYEKTKTLHATE